MDPRPVLQPLVDWNRQSSTFDHEVDPCVFVRICTSSQFLSKSGQSPFSIKLNMVVTCIRPVTISTYNSLIHDLKASLLGGGLMFRDIDTRELAERWRISHASDNIDKIDGIDPSIREIPPINGTTTQPPFEVTFCMCNADADVSHSDYSYGLELGHQYEILLHPRMAFFDYWWRGPAIELFPTPYHAKRPENRLPLPMRQVNRPIFMVIH